MLPRFENLNDGFDSEEKIKIHTDPKLNIMSRDVPHNEP